MNSFMSSIKSAASGAGDDDKKSNTDQKSNTDLLSSAKLVAEAAQSAATNQTDKIDKPKVAGATADLLDSVKQYGKFDESQGVGQYIKQADDYLHQYEKSSGTGTGTVPPVEAPASTKVKEAETLAPEEEEGKKDEALAPEEEKKVEAPTPAKEKIDEAPTPVEVKGGKEESGSEFEAGDAFKAAGSLFK